MRDKVEISTKKLIMLSVMLIAITGALVGIGTYAYFSATAVSGPNNFFTGSISISVNGQDPWTGNFNATLNDIKPGMKGWGNVTILNTGMNPADVWLQINNVTTTSFETNSAKTSDPAYPAKDIDNVTRYDIYKDGTAIIQDSDNYLISGGAHQLAATNNMTRDNWTYLGNLQPNTGWNINQSFMLDAGTTNWAQLTNMTFTVVIYAQQSQGTTPPGAPTPETIGHGRV
jgi:predicted ribosomally synthesized peptide with SipW-like signal peptide